MSGLFGASNVASYPQAGAWLVQTPNSPWAEDTSTAPRAEGDPVVEYCRNADAILKREKQEVTERQTRSINLYRGATPWWRNRPRWKIGSRFNWCAWVPMKWTQVLGDSESRITYSAYRVEDQPIADICSAAFKQAYDEGQWGRVRRNAILDSRIQIKSFLRLTPDPIANGGTGRANLVVVSGDQLYVDANASCVDDADVIEYEYKESPNRVFARWPSLREKIMRKRSENRGFESDNKDDVLSPATQQIMPTGTTVNNPPYAASANPPDNAGSTAGLIIREFWTRPRTTITLERILFTVAGEPATQDKTVTFTDGTTEKLRRVITEGNVIYEWPESFVGIIMEMMPAGGLRILEEMDALEVLTEDAKYPLYPEGRLTIIVDEDFKAEDRMNPLGYIPFIEIEAYPDPTGFWGMSDIDMIADAYEYYVRLLCMLLDAANLTANPIWRLPLSSQMSDEDITNAPGAIQREDLNSLRFGKREPGPDMPPYVIQLIAKIEDLIMKLSNLNEVATGQAKFKGQQSAETVAMYQETGAVSFRDALQSVQRADAKLGEQFKILMTRFYTTPQLVRVKNDAGVFEAIPLLGSHLIAPLKVEAKPGSSLPSSPTSRLTMALNMLQSGQPLVDLPEIWQLMQEVGYINSASALERRLEKEMMDPKQAWKVPGRPGAQGTNTKPKSKKAGSRRSRAQGGGA